MYSSETSSGSRHGTNWGTQLSFDQLSFDTIRDSSQSRKKFADQAHAILTGKTENPQFQIDEISENTFSIRLRHNGRSYRLNGIYVKEHIRSPDWGDFPASIIRIVRFDNILACRDGRYTVPVPHGKERETLQGSAHTILSDSLCYGMKH